MTMISNTRPFLSALNDEQLAAATAPIDRPTLVIAGAGSGKTSTLIARLQYLIAEGVNPSKIAAMTFTAKAAGEMRSRLPNALAERVSMRTMHSFGYERVRAYRAANGLSHLRVVDMRYVLRNLSGKPYGEWKEAIGMPTMDLSFVMGAISLWRELEVLPVNALKEFPERSPEWWCAKMFDAYTRYKARTSQLDFDDMLFMLLDIYATDPGFLATDRATFTHGMIDELQDTSAGQWRLIRMLWESQPLFGVGDPRQAIYEWRGARPNELLAFTERWPDAVVVNLATNYRSTPEIVEAASKLIAGTIEDEASAPLVAHRPSLGFLPEVRYFDSEGEEAAWVAGDIKRRRIEWSSSSPAPAILYRTNAQSASFEMMLSAFEVPFQVRGGSFWQRSEIRSLVAYLQLATDHNNGDALRLCVSSPSRYLGAAFVDAVVALSHEEGCTLLEAISQVRRTEAKALHGGQIQAAGEFSRLLRSLDGMAPIDALNRVLARTRFTDWLYSQQGSSDGSDDNRADAIDMLTETAAKFKTIAELVKYVGEQQATKDDAPDPAKVQLMTIHRAKGLEWPTVYVVGVHALKLPHPNGEEREERRLAYVALTRAQDRLVVTCPGDESEYIHQAGLRYGVVVSGEEE